MCARVLLPHASAAAQVHVARFSADGARVFTASDDARAICWDVAAEAQVRTFEGHCDRVRSGRINPASADLFFTGALHGPRAALPPLRAPQPTPASRKLAIPLPSPDRATLPRPPRRFVRPHGPALGRGIAAIGHDSSARSAGRRPRAAAQRQHAGDGVSEHHHRVGPAVRRARPPDAVRALEDRDGALHGRERRAPPLPLSTGW